MSVVVPGDTVHDASVSGPGTCIWKGTLRAAIAGQVAVDASTGKASVLDGRKQQRAMAPLPTIGDTVTCRVTRISPRMAHLDIICVGSVPLRDPCAGVLRREDVRPIDAGGPVEMHRCFRPNDIVLASVLSLGDARAYYLSTCASEHGVSIAKSAEGARMVPVSWCEMECPLSKVRERRKVAKPADKALPNVQESLNDPTSEEATKPAKAPKLTS
jgi:exosome complex component CSL4